MNRIFNFTSNVFPVFRNTFFGVINRRVDAFSNGTVRQFSINSLSGGNSLEGEIKKTCNDGLPYQPVRYKIRLYYKMNSAKRIKKHGLPKRLNSKGGLMMLWRKVIKGRHKLSTFDYRKGLDW